MRFCVLNKNFTVTMRTIMIKKTHFQCLSLYLQKLHKCKGHRASKFLLVFWFSLTVCALPQLRWIVNRFNIDFSSQDTLWSSYNVLSFTTFFVLISLMTILSAFSDKPPKNSTYPKSENPSPELKAGALDQLFFQWFSTTTWIGFKRPLTEDDVYDVNPQFTSNELVPIFDKNFERSIQKNANKLEINIKENETATPVATNGSVLNALWKSFGSQLMFSLFLRIIIDLIQFVQPFLLRMN